MIAGKQRASPGCPTGPQTDSLGRRAGWVQGQPEAGRQCQWMNQGSDEMIQSEWNSASAFMDSRERQGLHWSQNPFYTYSQGMTYVLFKKSKRYGSYMKCFNFQCGQQNQILNTGWMGTKSLAPRKGAAEVLIQEDLVRLLERQEGPWGGAGEKGGVRKCWRQWDWSHSTACSRFPHPQVKGRASIPFAPDSGAHKILGQ